MHNAEMRERERKGEKKKMVSRFVRIGQKKTTTTTQKTN